MLGYHPWCVLTLQARACSSDVPSPDVNRKPLYRDEKARRAGHSVPQRLALDATLVTRIKSFNTVVELLYESVGDINLFNLVGSCKCLWLYFAPHETDAKRCSLFSSFLFGFVPGQDNNMST